MLTRVLFCLAVLFGAAAAASAEDAKVVALGLTDHAVTQEELAKGAALAKPHFNTPAVAYVLAAGLKKGDTVEIALDKDGEPLMHNIQELDADEAKVLLQAGKTGVPAGGWPEGTYTASVKITRDGKPLMSEQTQPMAFE
jgi:hypothetical protein